MIVRLSSFLEILLHICIQESGAGKVHIISFLIGCLLFFDILILRAQVASSIIYDLFDLFCVSLGAPFALLRCHIIV